MRLRAQATQGPRGWDTQPLLGHSCYVRVPQSDGKCVCVVGHIELIEALGALGLRVLGHGATLCQLLCLELCSLHGGLHPSCINVLCLPKLCDPPWFLTYEVPPCDTPL